MSRFRNTNDDGVELGRAIAEGQTDLALRVRVTKPTSSSIKPNDELWIPKSVIHDDSECFGMGRDEREGKLFVKSWWAEKNGHA